MTKKLTMRELKGSDTFKMLSIINKLGAGDLIKGVFGEDDSLNLKDFKEKKPTKAEMDEIVEKRGAGIVVQVVSILTEKLPTIEVELNTFLGELTETDAETVGDLPFDKYIELITDFFKKEELKSFFSSLTSLMK